MAERERPAHIKAGHLFDTTPVRLDLWRLLLIFLADREFATLTQDEFFADGYQQLLLGLSSEFAEDEASRILLSSAIALRVLDDRDGVLEHFGPCGELQANLQAGDTLPLTLREACNKIVHAEQMNYDVERLDGGPIDQPGISPAYIRPLLYLYGTHRKTKWRCVLDVVSYVRGAAAALRA